PAWLPPIAEVLSSPCPASFPGRPRGGAQGDDRIDGPASGPDGDDGRAEEDCRRLGGAHQILGSLARGGARVESSAQALLGDAERSAPVPSPREKNKRR